MYEYLMAASMVYQMVAMELFMYFMQFLLSHLPFDQPYSGIPLHLMHELYITNYLTCLFVCLLAYKRNMSEL